jgi:hypothetical protein
MTPVELAQAVAGALDDMPEGSRIVVPPGLDPHALAQLYAIGEVVEDKQAPPGKVYVIAPLPELAQ